MPETKIKPPTIADCDRYVLESWEELQTNPKADKDECRQKIDLWLDARLLLMQKRKK